MLHGPIAGGAVIGAGAATKLGLTGRVYGVSGPIGGLLRGQQGMHWRAACVAGLLGGGVALRLFAPDAFYSLPESFPLWRAIAGGLLVGYGTSIADGCTAGHAVGGLSRFSPRSLASVLAFTAAGSSVATVLHSREATLNLYNPALLGETGPQSVINSIASSCAALLAATLSLPWTAGPTKVAEILADGALGVACALGLGISGMLSPHKVARFLDLSDVNYWDPAPLFTLGAALAVAVPLTAWIRKQFVPRQPAPPLGGTWQIPHDNKIDSKLLLGSALFGAGWGMCCFTPGSALVALAQPGNQAPVMVFSTAMAAGMLLSKYLEPQ